MGQHFLFGCRAPQPHGLVTTTRSQGGAIRGESEAGDVVLVPPQSGLRLTGNDVPEYDRAVFAGRGQRLTVGAERHGPYRDAVPLEGVFKLPGFGVPELEVHAQTSRG